MAIESVGGNTDCPGMLPFNMLQWMRPRSCPVDRRDSMAKAEEEKEFLRAVRPLFSGLTVSVDVIHRSVFALT